MKAEQVFNNTLTGIVLLGVATGIGLAGLLFGMNVIRNQAIQHGYAEYNATNGAWQWKTNLPIVVTNTMVITNTVSVWPRIEYYAPVVPFTNWMFQGWPTNYIIPL